MKKQSVGHIVMPWIKKHAKVQTEDVKFSLKPIENNRIVKSEKLLDELRRERYSRYTTHVLKPISKEEQNKERDSRLNFRGRYVHFLKLIAPTFVTRENLLEKVKYAVENETNHNYALKSDGTKLYGKTPDNKPQIRLWAPEPDEPVTYKEITT